MQQQQQSNMMQVPFIQQGFNTGETTRFMGTFTDAPTHNDILLGRGVATNRHPGNEKFRAIVSQHVDDYMNSTKKQKMMISRSIVKEVKTELVGRFLEKDPDNICMWREVKEKRALEKTAQALRDGAAQLRKQLTKDMSDPAFLESIFDEKAASSKQSLSTPMVVPSSKSDKKHRRTISSSSAESTNDMPALKKQKPEPDMVGSSMDNFFMADIMEPQSCPSQEQQHFYESISQHHQVSPTPESQLGVHAASQPLQIAQPLHYSRSFNDFMNALEPVSCVSPPQEDFEEFAREMGLDEHFFG